ncbi:hypothetical protein [Clostridium polynesiense]|uniref:hypothetical protein n=1 Tax=Clostridium polynesiense TaxID=1325933 RepID=UPI00058F7612|nr:hypothetical protein [Clostridium polynesiense]
MKDVIFDDFQNSVNECLLRHRSILDILTKYQESQAKVNRAVAKAITNCGCIKLSAEKQHLPEEYDSEDTSIRKLSECLKSHMEGNLCENCREVIEREMGNNIFYLTSLCNVLDLNLYDILIKEYDKINTLGKFNLR